jgi:hypothetical protein
MAKKNYTENEFLDLCFYWQEILRLKSWDIEFIFCSKDGLEGSSSNYGECDIDDLNEDAIVRVWNDNGKDDKYDIEHTLVHELLHIILGKLDLPKKKCKTEEQIINSLSKTFVQLRGGV